MALIDKFNKTNLDVQNPLPLGGPNRTNSYNIPTGLYESNRSTNIFNISTNYDISVLKEKDNTTKKFQLHKYTPSNKYLLSKDWEDKFNQY